MRKAVLTTAVLFLSSAWVIAQSSQYPSSQQPSAPTAPDASQTSPAAADKGSSHSVEGCVGGSAGAYTLTDSSGKTYQLAGDTSKLAEHVGHQVQVSGTAEPSSAGAAASAGGQQTLTVKKVKMLSSTCPNK